MLQFIFPHRAFKLCVGADDSVCPQNAAIFWKAAVDSQHFGADRVAGSYNPVS